MRHTVLSVLAFAGALAAQNSIVIPVGLANVPASSSTAYPFGLGASSRIQYLYHASETGLGTPILIRSIDLRAQETSANAAKANVDLQIELSTTAITPATATTTFANNRGTNHAIA